MRRISLTPYGLLCGVIAIAALAFLVDVACGERITRECRVIEKHYEPARHEYGHVTGFDAGGHSTMQTIGTYTPEEFTLLVECEGDVLTRTVSRDTYASASPGRSMPLGFTRGALTGGLW